jgi:hypothetical protein
MTEIEELKMRRKCQMKKAILALCGIMLLMLETFTPCCVAEESKRYTDEFLFVNSYLECLENYISIQTYDGLMVTGRANYSSEEVVGSAFMKQLKKEQEFISEMIRAMGKYSDSPVDSIKNASNTILEKYQKMQALNTKAQDAYFHVKTGQFKAGILTGSELFDEKQAIESGMFFEEENLMRQILFPKGSSVMKITAEEKKQLQEKIRSLKQISLAKEHSIGEGEYLVAEGGQFLKFFLQAFQRFIDINFPCLKTVA